MPTGSVATLMLSTETQLKLAGDEWVLLKDLQVHIGRPEDRTPTTDAGAIYTYGKGDHWLTFTVIGSPTEIDSLAALNEIDANGGMPTASTWTVVGTAVSGAVATLTCTGYLRDMDYRKGTEGKVELDCFIRITADTVAVAVT